jgi:hypothetical protein
MKSYTVHYKLGLYRGSTGNGKLKFIIKFNVGSDPGDVGRVWTSLRV